MKACHRITTLAVGLDFTPRIGLSRALSRPWSRSTWLFSYSRYEATHTDIVEHVRIVTTYDMWLDGVHMSTSVASFEFEPIELDHHLGTRFTHVEHGVSFDQFWAHAPNREAGSRGLLNALAAHLA